jgi:hypothetical protein
MASGAINGGAGMPKQITEKQRARRGRPPKQQQTAPPDLARARSLKVRRFELKLSEIDFERIERLLGLTGAASMGEVIRDAVREYEAKILSGKKTHK